MSQYHWLAAIRLPIGPQRFRECLHFYDNNIEHLFQASAKELAIHQLKPHEIVAIKNPDWDVIANDIHWCEKNNCHIIVLPQNTYPKLLREISSAPLVLFVQGNIDLLQQPQIAMVGSRNPSPMGYETAQQFATCLASSGLVITSGLAIGIDTACHRGALVANGKTIAVTGAGLQHIYPPQNRALAEEIIQSGALVSEFLPTVRPLAQHFPRRNRIISGLSLGVLVVEAALKSGSLISAKFAVEQGREVFAIPGSIHHPLARGCHQLIRQGAKLVETAEDILEEINMLYHFVKSDREIIKPVAQYAPMTNQEQAVLQTIGFEVTALDTIVKRSGLTMSKISSMLLSLELNGYISSAPGGYVKNAVKV